MRRAQALFDRLRHMSDSEFADIADSSDGEQLLASMVGVLGGVLDDDPSATERYRTALEEIVNPMQFMQERVKASGDRLSDMAYGIANDVGYLRDIARKALEAGRGNPSSPDVGGSEASGDVTGSACVTATRPHTSGGGQ